MKRARGRVLVWCVWWAFVPDTSAFGADLQRFEFTQQQMGTTFRFVLYAQNQEDANHAAAAAGGQIAVLNEIFSDYTAGSEARRLGDSHVGFGEGGIRVSDDLWKVLVAADRLSRDSEGAFDVTVGPLTKLWRRARRQQSLPDAKLIAEAKSGVGYRRLELLEPTHSVRIRGNEPLRLDFGGIAKGYAADAALRILTELGIRRALIDAGGDLRLGAAPPDREGWKVAITSRRSAQPDMTLILSDCGVATSGDVWQFLEFNGQRYSHIIDPRTGLGLTNRTAVTIVAPNATIADGLASAVSVLGIDEGAKLLESTVGESASDAVRGKAMGRIVAFDADGISLREVRETSGFADLPRVAMSEVELPAADARND